MTVLPTGELAGLPEGGPATLAAVKLQLRIAVTDVRDDTELTEHVDAVNAQLRRLPIARYALLTDPPEWPADIAKGANLLAVRLWRRKDSPAGTEAMPQLGAAYIARSDPDVAQLLQLGPWAHPQVG